MAIPVTLNSLRKVLEAALTKDKVRILRKAKKVFGYKGHEIPQDKIPQEKLDELALEAALAVEIAQKRLAHIPTISYPENLPVSQHHEELAELIKKNQVVIIAGDTGSGKTTQLPKICLEAGLGRKGIIGHTQTRRLATRTVASRISEELKVELGKEVGFKVRFSDKTSEDTIIKLMTDGVLLAELEQDRFLNDYEVLIIDEAHERSLNIDFILGFLKQLLDKRKDLKVIVTSATIDVERFSKHFNNAPIKIVEGRTYPVEVIYSPLEELQLENEEEEIDEDILFEGVLRAIHEVSKIDFGDILIFLNGERDIAEMSDFLRKANLVGTEILPLYARLNVQEQNRIFAPHGGRRIVLATNVAETSVTVPGIKYVIDPGTARISRYNQRTKVQRLPIEPISQASANQRKGRCGRVAEGVCIRLYSEQDFLSRQEFTDPEILRTNLSAVILKMLSLKIEDINHFPFVDAPEQKLINDGVKLLEELGAVSYQNTKSNDGTVIRKLVLTKRGVLMSKLSCDPRLARMLIEANDQHALSEMLIIASNLSAQETRERPLQWREAATNMHKRFDDEKSDFRAIVNLYNYLQEILANNSNSSVRKIMRKEFLSYLRMREWFDIKSQLENEIKDLGFKINELPATYEQLHRSLLSGLLGFIGTKSLEGYEYLGTRSSKFFIFPGSGLAKRAPKWIMSAEITETSKIYARVVAEIDPKWCEDYAKDLIKYSYSDEHWSKKSGTVLAKEKGMLYGLPIINERTINYSKINPLLCRELFIREGLVCGELFTNAKFFKHNLDLVAEIVELEDKSRRRDLLVNDDTLFAFYDERVPEDCVDQRTFEKWWQHKLQSSPDFLNFDSEMLKNKDTSMITEDDYPSFFSYGHFKLPLEYNFDPSLDNDGITAIIPINVLNQINEDDFLWLVPGCRLELFTALIKSLPKVLRKCFVPAPNYAQQLFEELQPSQGYFWDVLTKKLTKLACKPITKQDFDLTQVPKHLSFVYRVIDIKKRTLMESRSLEHIKHKLKDEVKESLAKVVKEMPKQENLKTFDFDSIPKTQKRVVGGMEIVAFPALRDTGKSVNLELFESEDVAVYEMWKGIRKLIKLAIPNPISYLEEKLPNKAKLAMYFNIVGNVKTLIEDLEYLALDEIIAANGGVVYTKSDFDKLVTVARNEIYERTLKKAQICEKILVKANEVKKKLKGKMDFQTAMAYSDMGGQFNRLIYSGFATDSGEEYFPHIERYLSAMLNRIEKVPKDPNRDLMQLNKINSVEKEYESLLGMFAGKLLPKDVKNVKFMIEELRVSYFAQSLKTLYPVSDKRLYIEIDRLKQLYRHSA